MGILIRSPDRLVRALCDSYEDGCRASGFGVSRINIGELDFPLMSTATEFAVPPDEPILSERQKILDADHVVLMFPLWLGGIPAKARGFLEQVARGAFFLDVVSEGSHWPRKMMKGKSIRVVVTMGMPGLIYKTWMDAGALKALERGLFGMSGFKPIHHTVIGGIGDGEHDKNAGWLSKMYKLGTKAS